MPAHIDEGAENVPLLLSTVYFGAAMVTGAWFAQDRK